jgi:hypothetical protein
MLQATTPEVPPPVRIPVAPETFCLAACCCSGPTSLAEAEAMVELGRDLFEQLRRRWTRLLRHPLTTAATGRHPTTSP